MNLEDYLKSIGRLKQATPPPEPVQEIDEDGPLTEKQTLNTIGEVFDYLKGLGYEKMPENISINAPGWPSYRIIN